MISAEIYKNLNENKADFDKCFLDKDRFSIKCESMKKFKCRF